MWSEAGFGAQTASGKRLQLLKVLRRKRIGPLLMEIKVPESGGEKKRHIICLKSNGKFPQRVMIWCTISSAGVILLCFITTKGSTAISSRSRTGIAGQNQVATTWNKS